VSKAYKDAGVDIEAGERAVASMSEAVSSTFNSCVLSKLGDFGGLFDLSEICKRESPVLVASTDGVGTKVEVARVMNRWDTVGQCLVNHCVNDILVQGAEPLFFLDFIGCRKLESEVVSSLVKGMATACKAQGAALLGGETAEMGVVYAEGGYEVAGTIVGVVDKKSLLDGSGIQGGDRVYGLPSTGLHTNGYTLARKVLQDLDWQVELLQGRPIGEHLLEVHRCYLPEVKALRDHGVEIKGLAHVTGGGISGNFQRILPDGLGARLTLQHVSAPPIFELIQRLADLPFEDMQRTFNLGVGMLIVLSPGECGRAEALLPELMSLGEITDRSGVEVTA
jgi:phosphoribosylformylglycinamidine cyclo-ligase